MYHEPAADVQLHPSEAPVAYVIIVEFRAKPDQIEAFARLIDRNAYDSRTWRTAASRSTSVRIRDVCQNPTDPALFYEVYRDRAAHGPPPRNRQLPALPGHGTPT